MAKHHTSMCCGFFSCKILTMSCMFVLCVKPWEKDTHMWMLTLGMVCLDSPALHLAPNLSLQCILKAISWRSLRSSLYMLPASRLSGGNLYQPYLWKIPQNINYYKSILNFQTYCVDGDSTTSHEWRCNHGRWPEAKVRQQYRYGPDHLVHPI